MKIKTLAALGVLTVTLAGCDRAPTGGAATVPAAATPISEAEAAKIADATVATWLSMDAAKIKAMYAPNVAGFDSMIGPLANGKAAWDKNQDGFVTAKMDGSTQKERLIQILDADTFVINGTWDVTSSAIPANNGAIRCTVVYEKDAAGAWLIANEHCSAVPKPA